MFYQSAGCPHHVSLLPRSRRPNPSTFPPSVDLVPPSSVDLVRRPGPSSIASTWSLQGFKGLFSLLPPKGLVTGPRRGCLSVPRGSLIVSSESRSQYRLPLDPNYELAQHLRVLDPIVSWRNTVKCCARWNASVLALCAPAPACCSPYLFFVYYYTATASLLFCLLLCSHSPACSPAYSYTAILLPALMPTLMQPLSCLYALLYILLSP